jgi:hypothetical protein
LPKQVIHLTRLLHRTGQLFAQLEAAATQNARPEETLTGHGTNSAVANLLADAISGA